MTQTGKNKLAEAAAMLNDACTILRSLKGRDAEEFSAAVQEWSANGLPITTEVEQFAQCIEDKAAE